MAHTAGRSSDFIGLGARGVTEALLFRMRGVTEALLFRMRGVTEALPFRLRAGAATALGVFRRDLSIHRSYGWVAAAGLASGLLGLVVYFFIARLVDATPNEIVGGDYFAFVASGYVARYRASFRSYAMSRPSGEIRA